MANRLPALILQASWDGTSMHFVNMTGREICRIDATAASSMSELQSELMRHVVGSMYSRIEVVLPGDRLLTQILSLQPSALLMEIL